MYKLLLLIVFCAVCIPAKAIDIDDKLRLIIEAHGLKRKEASNHIQKHDKSLAKLGKLIFDTKILSGNKDTACATCHIDSKELTDGLPISVGVGGSLEGTDRMLEGNGIIVPRNSFTLRGRADTEFSAYFWDGKVQNHDGKIFSQIAEKSNEGFQSTLSVAAVIPLLARDEFLGIGGDYESRSHLRRINDAYYQEKYEEATTVIREILTNDNTEDATTIVNELERIGIDPIAIELSDIGNAISSFIAQDQSPYSTPWTKYIEGDINALTHDQKEGAFLFYGKGRCASCHAGPLMSDFKYHSIATPQRGFGTNLLGQDFGRSAVSLNPSDKYKFRTPPLILVSKTAPYGHNGAFKTMKDAIEYHLNPVDYFLTFGWSNERERLTFGKILSSRDQLLSFSDITSEEEINKILEFLQTI